MKVVILAGGFGSRLSEYTDKIPKPMVEIGSEPILIHLIKYFMKFNLNDFIIALGYKSEYVKSYFINYKVDSSFSFNLFENKLELKKFNSKIKTTITLVDTGIGTMTGGRIKRLENFLGREDFLLTYGDGLSNVPIDQLMKFHKNHNKLATVTAVRPPARFGEIQIEEDEVKSFKEKPQTDKGWINGGFFIFKPQFLEYLKSDDTVLEQEPLECVAKEGKLNAFRHDGFWQCMDTKRDKDLLEELFSSNAPWLQ